MEQNDWKKYSLAIRSAPSNRVADMEILVDTMKGLVRSSKCVKFCLFLNHPVALALEMSLRCRRLLLRREKQQRVRFPPEMVLFRPRHQYASYQCYQWMGAYSNMYRARDVWVVHV